MPGLYPNPSAAPENFKIGDDVKWYVNENEISPYVGKVTEICPGIQKVWVEWPVGGNQQMDPESLILVPPEQGRSPVKQETGYSDYDKQRSKENYGTISPETKKMAREFLAKQDRYSPEQYKLKKQAKKVYEYFAENVVEKLSSDVCSCLEKEMTDIEAYQNLYPKYSFICSDSFLRKSILDIYDAQD